MRYSKQMEKSYMAYDLGASAFWAVVPDEENIEDTVLPADILMRALCTILGSMGVEIMRPIGNGDLKQKNPVQGQNPKKQDLVGEKAPNVEDSMTIDTSVRIPLSVLTGLDDLKRECLYALRTACGSATTRVRLSKFFPPDVVVFCNHEEMRLTEDNVWGVMVQLCERGCK